MFRFLTWVSFVGFIVSLGLWGLGDGGIYGVGSGVFIALMLGFACMDISGKLPS